MKRYVKALLILLSGFVLTTALVYAQTGGGYDLTWRVVASGGSVSIGSGYALNATSGQSNAGLLSGGGYALNGGFWHSNTIAENYKVYLPLIIK